MLLSIRHATTYTYDQPVILEPHCLRLTPRADGYGSLLGRSLKIFPEPVSMSISVENDGSISHWVRFGGSTSSLTIEAKSRMSITSDKNPFDFLVYPESCLILPMVYPPSVLRELQSFMLTEHIAIKVRDFALEMLKQAKGQTIDFLVMLCLCMKQDFIYEFRQSGSPYQPEHTLVSRRGSCRDWAILYMACAKSVGLAARFVSGYYFDEKPELPDLHAWVEVYIPGGGWRGFDPSLGLACYGHHIPLASGVLAGAAAPIQGNFKGASRSEMKLELEYKYSPGNSVA